MENNNSKEEKEFIEVLRRKCKKNQHIETEYQCGDYRFDIVLFQDNYPIGVFELKQNNFSKELLLRTQFGEVIVNKYIVNISEGGSYTIYDVDNSMKVVDLDGIFRANPVDRVPKQNSSWQLTYLYCSSIIVGISFMVASVLNLFDYSYPCCSQVDSWIILGALGGVLIIAPSILSGVTALKIGLRNGYLEIITRDTANNKTETN